MSPPKPSEQNQTQAEQTDETPLENDTITRSCPRNDLLVPNLHPSRIMPHPNAIEKITNIAKSASNSVLHMMDQEQTEPDPLSTETGPHGIQETAVIEVESREAHSCKFYHKCEKRTEAH